MHIKSSTSKKPHNPPTPPASSPAELTRKFDGLSITEKLNTLFTKDMLTRSTSANLDYLKKLAKYDIKSAKEYQSYRDELRFWLTVDKALRVKISEQGLSIVEGDQFIFELLNVIFTKHYENFPANLKEQLTKSASFYVPNLKKNAEKFIDRTHKDLKKLLGAESGIDSLGDIPAFVDYLSIFLKLRMISPYNLLDTDNLGIEETVKSAEAYIKQNDSFYLLQEHNTLSADKDEMSNKRNFIYEMRLRMPDAAPNETFSQGEKILLKKCLEKLRQSGRFSESMLTRVPATREALQLLKFVSLPEGIDKKLHNAILPYIIRRYVENYEKFVENFYKLNFDNFSQSEIMQLLNQFYMVANRSSIAPGGIFYSKIKEKYQTRFLNILKRIGVCQLAFDYLQLQAYMLIERIEKLLDEATVMSLGANLIFFKVSLQSLVDLALIPPLDRMLLCTNRVRALIKKSSDMIEKDPFLCNVVLFASQANLMDDYSDETMEEAFNSNGLDPQVMMKLMMCMIPPEFSH
jgi:hypothetical protein